MEALMDTATIETTTQGTEVVLERRRRSTAAPLRAERTVR
jgi:hypothetical protein